MRELEDLRKVSTNEHKSLENAEITIEVSWNYCYLLFSKYLKFFDKRVHSDKLIYKPSNYISVDSD